MKFGVEHSRVLPGSILTASCVELASAWWPFASHESWHCIHEKLASLPWQGLGNASGVGPNPCRWLSNGTRGVGTTVGGKLRPGQRLYSVWTLELCPGDVVRKAPVNTPLQETLP